MTAARQTNRVQMACATPAQVGVPGVALPDFNVPCGALRVSALKQGGGRTARLSLGTLTPEPFRIERSSSGSSTLFLAERVIARHCINGRRPLQLAPSDVEAGQRCHHRFEDDVVHDLAVAEALQGQPPQQRPLFALFDGESDRRTHRIDQGKNDKARSREGQVGKRRAFRLQEKADQPRPICQTNSTSTSGEISANKIWNSAACGIPTIPSAL